MTKNGATSRKIIILASCGIGDLILATPLFANIKRLFPASSITLVLRRDLPPEFRLLCRHIDEAFLYPPSMLLTLLDRRLPRGTGPVSFLKKLGEELWFLRRLRRERFDFSFSLFPGGAGYDAVLAWCINARRRFGPRSGIRNIRWYTDRVTWDANRHVVENNLDQLRILGLEPVIKELCLKLREQDIREAAEFYREKRVADDETLIAVHPGITGAKNYWPLDRVVVVVKYLVSKPGVKVALFAGPEEAAALSMFKNLPVIAITGRSFPLFCALLARCRLAFSSDTMLGHAAAALKIPTITIYGRGNQNKHNRWGVPDYSINKLSKEDYPGPEKSFWAGDAGRAALEQVTVSEVTELFEQALFAIGKR